MVHQDIYLKDYNWKLSVWYARTKYNLAGVMTDLSLIDCPPKEQEKFLTLMNKNLYNCGMTYSNFDLQESVMVIGLASEPSQYFNSIVHEIGHPAEHIIKAYGYEMEGERPYYIMGKVAQKMYPVCHKLTCPKCQCEKKRYS